MALHLHPTRREALAAGNTTLTRWSLDGARPVVLARHSVAPLMLRQFSYMQDGRPAYVGDVATAPDGELFALQSPPRLGDYTSDPCVIELRRWDDLRIERTIVLPFSGYDVTALAWSPDGRWIVAADGGSEWVHLVDSRTGQVSHRVEGSTTTTGLAFDPTSTLMAGIRSYDGGGRLILWRLLPADEYVPHSAGPATADHGVHQSPPDAVYGEGALTVVHDRLDRRGITWADRDLADTIGSSTFGPDNRLVVFCLMSAFSNCLFEMSAYDPASGERLWCSRCDETFTAAPIFTADGSHLVVSEHGGEVLVYRADNGVLVQRLPTGIAEPITGLAFDRDGATLWLATEDGLQVYRSRL